jgi:sugar phosphate permease
MLRPVACVGAGFVADRVGASRTIIGAFVVMIAGFASFVLTPPAPGTAWLLWVNTMTICASVFALRGIYYALMEEGRIPLHLTGTAVGVVSIIGYAPDILAPTILGGLLDAMPGAAGHKRFFTMLLVGGGIGLVAALIVRRMTAGNESPATEAVEAS